MLTNRGVPRACVARRLTATKQVSARRVALLVRCQASTPAAVVDQVELGKSGEVFCVDNTAATHTSRCNQVASNHTLSFSVY
jgi:hypothetical protein